ncbi:MAG: GH39 family glycosyl hydrolase [Myxococcota bacterium]
MHISVERWVLLLALPLAAACSDKKASDSPLPRCVAGDVCAAEGDRCETEAKQACRCVGPQGARYVTCDAANVGGASSGGIGGNGSGGGSAGSVFMRPSTGGTSTYAADVGRPCADEAPWSASANAPDYELVVDAAGSLGPWNRFYEQSVAADHANTILKGAWGRNIQNALKKAHDQAGFETVRFHGVLNYDIGIYTEVDGQPKYNFERLDQAYDAILLAGMRPFVEISFTPPDLASERKWLHWYNRSAANISPPKDWNRWGELMRTLVEHWVARYGAEEVRSWYFEVWNEASWMYTEGLGAYNELYEYTIKGLLAGDPNLRVGGPAESSGGSMGAITSLLSYTARKGLKLDFISYHSYATDAGAIFGNAARQVSFHESIVEKVRGASFPGDIVVTEWGPSSSTDLLRDTEASASFVVKTIHGLASSEKAPPPTGYAYWTVSDIYEEIDTGPALAYREGNYGLFLKGDPNIPESFDVAKPAFNAFRLLHWLGDTRLPVVGGLSGDGVDAIATLNSDASAAQVLVHHHVAGKEVDETLSPTVKLTIDHLPFAAGPLKLRHYVVDKMHSNSYTTWVELGKPEMPTAEQWVALRDAADLCYYESEVEPVGGSVSISFPQRVRGLSFVTLKP